MKSNGKAPVLSKCSLQRWEPVRLLGSGVRFSEEVEECKESPQQLLTLDRPLE